MFLFGIIKYKEEKRRKRFTFPKRRASLKGDTYTRNVDLYSSVGMILSNEMISSCDHSTYRETKTNSYRKACSFYKWTVQQQSSSTPLSAPCVPRSFVWPNWLNARLCGIYGQMNFMCSVMYYWKVIKK